MVGNDIVDLHHFETPRYQNLRYLDRVTVLAESTTIRGSRDPVLALSSVWAAKEAAYKLLCKQGIGSHFIPREFVVKYSAESALLETAGTVTYRSRVIPVLLKHTEQWVHAIATVRSTQLPCWLVENIQGEYSNLLSTAEESIGTRRLAAKLLASIGAPQIALAYSRRIPYLTFASGKSAYLDISLSHHGRFAAAAVAPREEQPLNHSFSSSDLPGSAAVEASCSTCMV